MSVRTNKAASFSASRGAVLLEVVLALVLFAAASVVIGIALNASMTSVERLRLSAQAADLSVTVFSELQAGIRSVASDPGAGGPSAPGESGTNVWTIEIVTQPWGGAQRDSGALTDVEVILRHLSGFTHRSRQVLKLKTAEPLSSVRSQFVRRSEA